MVEGERKGILKEEEAMSPVATAGSGSTGLTTRVGIEVGPRGRAPSHKDGGELLRGDSSDFSLGLLRGLLVSVGRVPEEGTPFSWLLPALLRAPEAWVHVVTHHSPSM
eukprot:GHVU01220875.1.p1 GENE.GHVU01220875.1~~GHVU01220875.1.p1  ORF type:complete len:108 (+),score=2.34 GHVU01220875.1:80-403(+)